MIEKRKDVVTTGDDKNLINNEKMQCCSHRELSQFRPQSGM